MKTLEQQISNKCIHFNGIMNKSCKAGVVYDDVKTGKPLQIPCLNTGGECQLCKFPTSDEVNKIVDEINDSMETNLIAYTFIKDHFTKTKEHSGKIMCECGGQLHYRIAKVNGHIWAKCNSCEVSFME